MRNSKMNGQSLNLQEKLLSQLQEQFPEVFTEGKIDPEKLKQTLGEKIDTGSERYGLSWAGKSNCFREIQKTTSATLSPSPEESVNFDKTKNLFIEGDNLEVLRILQRSYYGKIKMIYIDPPYNTGNDFIYDDNFKQSKSEYEKESGQKNGNGDLLKDSALRRNSKDNGHYHSDWLSMMYPRLFLARNLLKKDGVIFVSIDDHEVYNLKLILDEIFGEENFVAMFSVENNPKGRKNSKFVSTSNDYCLVYAKYIGKSYFIENIPKNIKDMVLDNTGRYVHGSGKRVLVGGNSFNKKVKDHNSDKHYSVYYSAKDNDIVIKKENSLDEIDEGLLKKGYVRYVSQRDGDFIENTYTETKLLELYEEEALDFQSEKIFEKNFNDKIRIKSLLLNTEYDALINNEKHRFKLDVKTTSAGQGLKKLFDTNDEFFTAPKNIGLIKILASLFDERDFIALDFFAGSATTAHAIMELNQEDGGNRKFIMVQLPELIEENSAAYRAGFKNISQLSIERIRRASEQIRNGANQSKLFSNHKPDFGMKVFRLVQSNFSQWQGQTQSREDLISQLELSIDNVKPDSQQTNILTELILKSGLELTEQVKKAEQDSVQYFVVGDNRLVVCLDGTVTKEFIDFLEELKPNKVIFLERIFANNDDLKTNAILNLERANIDFKVV